jgi:hypothetical protein
MVTKDSKRLGQYQLPIYLTLKRSNSPVAKHLSSCVRMGITSSTPTEGRLKLKEEIEATGSRKVRETVTVKR